MLRDDFIKHLKASGRSHRTIQLRLYWLTRFEAHYSLQTCSLGDIEAFLASGDWSQSTARSVRSSIVVYIEWLYKTGRREDNPTRALGTIKERPPCPKPLPDSLYHVALQGASERVRLMMRLASEAGLRRGEVARVHARDVEDDLLGKSLRVFGKGGKVRRVPISDSLARAVLNMAQGGYCFEGAIQGHMTEGHVGKLVGDCLPQGWSMHSLRHRFATRAYHATGDIYAVKELLGHTSLATTERYVAQDAGRLRRVALAAA